MNDLKRLSELAAQGKWAYRPDKYDDWGMIRAGYVDDPHIGAIRPPAAEARPLWHDDDFDQHRKSRTDPMAANGEFIVALVNAYRSGRLVEANGETFAKLEGAE